MDINKIEQELPENITQPERTELWYEKFNQSEHIAADGTYGLTPDIIPEDRLHLKVGLIAEEFFEFIEAVYGKKSSEIMKTAFAKAVLFDDKNRDIVEAADATGDLRVVLDGFDLETGIPTEAIAHEILMSNMSKLGEDGLPILSDGVTPSKHSGKVLPLGKIDKGPNFFDADFEAILNGEEPDRTPLKDKTN